MGIIKGFTFDGVNSLDYNIGITGSAVYNAPTRDVEMISIPGRDGEYALDHGRFNNIEITYPSGMGDNDQTNFAQRVSDLRNQLASRVGYKRLEDEYNPDEYRMAIYKSGLEVSPVQYSRAGQFDITFDCKPQRFLKSGESAVSKANNSTITNPTLFDAHPLISFNASGDGTITIGDKPLNFYNKPLGVIPLPYVVYNYRPTGNYYCLDLVTFDENTPHNTGDAFTFVGAKATLTIQSETEISHVYFATGQALRYIPGGGGVSGNTATITLEDWQESSFVYGTARTVTKSVEWRISVAGSSTYQTQTITLELIYGGANTVRVRWSATLTSGMTISSGSSSANYVANVDSTANSLTGDLYIDLDIGEAYRIENGGVVSINNFVNLGGELPTLPPGNTTITYDNTISNFKITPRWWKI